MNALPSLKLRDDEASSSTSYKTRIIACHILAQLEAHRQVQASNLPLFVAVQGPQGCGKTTVCSAVQSFLQARPYNLRMAVLSLDDLYLDHEGLRKVAATSSDNYLLSGRGQPGTHDVSLGISTLSSIHNINTSNAPVHLPIFDKSLYGGEGDRSTSTVLIEPGLDVFLFEGWSVGFNPWSDEELERKFESVPGDSYLKRHDLKSLQTLNTSLREVADGFYPYFTVFIKLTPVDLRYVFRWRLQQEQQMKALNGGRGMPDKQVKLFIERYMPGYELWGDSIRHASAKWAGHGLDLLLGEDREVIGIENF